MIRLLFFLYALNFDREVYLSLNFIFAIETTNKWHNVSRSQNLSIRLFSGEEKTSNESQNISHSFDEININIDDGYYLNYSVARPFHLIQNSSLGHKELNLISGFNNTIASNNRTILLHYKYQDVGFTSLEITEILRLHNHYRGLVEPPAGDMRYLEWDFKLANIAQTWLLNCESKTDHIYDPNYGRIGLNLYLGDNRDPKHAVIAWEEEKKFYDFYYNTCDVGKNCGYYTQLVWSRTRHIGCSVLKNRFRNQKYYIACSYWPAGNTQGNWPYKVGAPCSLCDSFHQGGICSENKCVSRHQCVTYNITCECNLECLNCGILDPLACTCICKDGWTSLDCSTMCQDRKKCFKSECAFHDRSDGYHPCMLTCGRCKDIKNPSVNTCCGGRLCKPGYVFKNIKACYCEVLCPGPICNVAVNPNVSSAQIVIWILVIMRNSL